MKTFTDIVLAVHGGAGVINRSKMTAAEERAYTRHLQQALTAGYRLLQQGRSSLDAVEASVEYLENCPLFNAGRGSVFTFDGKHELDAAIMDGTTRAAGAVAAVRTIKNPIVAARAVMEQTPHVMLVGKGAERFARNAGLKIVAPDYFWTAKMRRRWQEVLQERRRSSRKSSATGADNLQEEGTQDGPSPQRKHGTVGAVACDRSGNLAAATSTGGTINKRFGRVGDSPIIGAGTYADNSTCAVSGTGQGEFFMRALCAYEVSALMKYKHISLFQAADQVINQTLDELGGEGGLIALDAQKRCAMPFNTAGMFRGCISAKEEIYTAIFKD